MPDDLVITGLGLVTPLGVGVDATWGTLLAGRYVSDLGRVVEPRDVTRSRVAQLGLLAAREAIGARADELHDAALIVGTSKGPVDEWLADAAANEQNAREAFPTGDEKRPRFVRSVSSTATLSVDRTRAHSFSDDAIFGLASLANELATSLPLRNSLAPRLTLSAACASGLHALARAALLLQSGDARAAVVVASESSLHPLWHGTFKNLGVLAPAGEPCRPLDAARAGFVISEAAAAIILERRPARPGEIVLERCLLASDATHMTGIDPTGRTLHSLIIRACDGRPIDFVHAHATATANDAVELEAIRATLGEGPTVYSHKGSLGHSLGASSLLAIVLSTLVHQTGRRPPMPTTLRSLDGSRERTSNVPIEQSLCLAAGFGGTLAAALLRTMR